jgi:hypothetical protein
LARTFNKGERIGEKKGGVSPCQNRKKKMNPVYCSIWKCVNSHSRIVWIRDCSVGRNQSLKNKLTQIVQTKDLDLKICLIQSEGVPDHRGNRTKVTPKQSSWTYNHFFTGLFACFPL